MNYYILCAAVFLGAYLLNLFYVTVLYHRGLAHSSVVLHPLTRKWVVLTGNWVTGLDPKGWACMHRLHHVHSDTPKDPHSPWNLGVFGVMLGQLRSYEKILVALKAGREPYASTVRDLDFDVNWLNRNKLWVLPYLLHAVIGLVIAFGFDAWLLGAAYWYGMMSHPIQGFMVNSFAHRFGYRNFNTPDRSQNNTAVAWLVFGEGFQNNHHAHPNAAKFSMRWFEVDAGYGLCKIGQALGILSIPDYRPAKEQVPAYAAAAKERPSQSRPMEL